MNATPVTVVPPAGTETVPVLQKLSFTTLKSIVASYSCLVAERGDHGGEHGQESEEGKEGKEGIENSQEEKEVTRSMKISCAG